MNILRAVWNPAHWWPVWLVTFIGAFLVREVWALASGHPQDTLSDWIWRHLHIVAQETVGQWSAADMLIFGAYVVVFVMWLPWHLFLRKFT